MYLHRFVGLRALGIIPEATQQPVDLHLSARPLSGDKPWGAEDPPTDGLLGQAIDRYIEQVQPLVLRETTAAFRREVLGE